MGRYLAWRLALTLLTVFLALTFMFGVLHMAGDPVLLLVPVDSSPEFIERSNLRINDQHFFKELLRDRKRSTGRFDTRLTATDLFAAGEQPDFDPSMAAVRPPFTAAFNDYVRNELGYKSDREYYILGGGIGRWDWGTNNSYVDTSDELRSAMEKNPYMKVFVASGLYDLATPYLGTAYTLDHLGLDQAGRQRITVRRYDAGHMLYTDDRCRVRLKEDVALFIGRAAGNDRRMR